MLKKPTIILDDHFTRRCLREIATGRFRWPFLSSDPMGLVKTRKKYKGPSNSCQKAFRDHYGLKQSSQTPDWVLPELNILTNSIDILIKGLGLGSFINDIRMLIASDWMAHVEIDKKPRYRDHINHPARVMAIGWWLMFRSRAGLLCSIAKKARASTRVYRKQNKIDVTSWWNTHPARDRFEKIIKFHVKVYTPRYRNGCLFNDPSLWPWLAIAAYAWQICGLLHDIGYASEVHLRSCDTLFPCFGNTLSFLGSAVGRALSSSCADDMIHAYKGSWFLQETPNLKGRIKKLAIRKNRGGMSTFRFDTENHPHALLGALHLMNRGVAERSSVKGLIIQMAARAITTHHDKDIENITDDGLSKLLYVADNLQGWGRPVFHKEPCRDKGLRMIRPIIECEKIVLREQSSEILCEFHMNPDANDWKTLRKKPYLWKFDIFEEVNLKIEKILNVDALYPNLIISQRRCIMPLEFLNFMDRQ